MPTTTASVVQLGTYDTRTDTFTLVLDLNDSTNIFQLDGSPEIGMPEKKLQTAGNPRMDGERVTNETYANRHVNLKMHFGKAASYTTIRALVTTFVGAVENCPIVLRYAPPSPNVSVNYSYFDVLSVSHNADNLNAKRVINGTMRVMAILTCAPYIRGDRQWLQNLAVNPGFEAPAGGGIAAGPIGVFADTFANTNAYTTVSGSAPSVASSVMSIPSGTLVTFGSPAWGAFYLWRIRFKWVTSLVADFYLHFTDGNNWLRTQVTNGALNLQHDVGGSIHTLGSSAPTLTNGNFYWAQFTQFPAPVNQAPYISAALFNDSAGAIGGAVGSGSLGPIATFDGVTALVGRCAIGAENTTLQIGGAFSSVDFLQLFGPGGWSFENFGTGTASMGWDGTRPEVGMSGTATPGTQTNNNGPVTSFGSLRIDLPPAGTPNAAAHNYAGGSPTGTAAIPVLQAGNSMAFSARVKTSGLAGTATSRIEAFEYDASGSALRSTVFTLTGNQASWTTLSGTVTTGANCAYLGIWPEALDTGATSANGIVWFDNIQVWNVTETGVAAGAMPYCELRFPNSPAQIMVSGLLGEIPAPAAIHFATYAASIGAGAVLNFWIGLRGYESAIAPILCTPAASFTPTLDTTAYNGFTQAVTMSSATFDVTWGYVQYLFQLRGQYRHLVRIKTSQSGTITTGNLSLTSAQVGLAQYPFSGVSNNVHGKLISPAFAASATMGVTDAGLITLPGSAYGALLDVNAVNTYEYVTITDPTFAGIVLTWNWSAMVPADENGTLITGQLTYPSALTTVSTQVFIDGLNAQLQRKDIGVSATIWPTTTPTFQMHPEYGISGAGIAGTAAAGGVLGVSLGQDSVPYLSPKIQLANGIAAPSAGVNQGVAVVSDTSGAAIYPFMADIRYSPLYLYPRS